MKEIDSIKKVSLTYNELMNVLNVKSNRCGYLKKDEAMANGFSEADWNRFISRAKKMKKTITEQGFSKASFFVLAKDSEGNIYLLDGQGRRMALKMMHDDDKKDFSEWEFVCDLYVDPKTDDEMNELIKEMNTGNTNWQTKDIRRSDVLAANNESVTEAYETVKKLEDEYGICNYAANLFTFGEKASHMRSKGTKPLSTSDYAITKDVFTAAYLKFIVNASYKKDKDGNDIERSKNTQNKLRSANLATALNTCMRKIVKSHNNILEDSIDDIDYFIDKMLIAFDGDDAYVNQLSKCDTNYDSLASKVKRYVGRKTVYQAVYATA